MKSVCLGVGLHGFSDVRPYAGKGMKALEQDIYWAKGPWRWSYKISTNQKARALRALWQCPDKALRVKRPTQSSC